jgi:hypothetical protein
MRTTVPHTFTAVGAGVPSWAVHITPDRQAPAYPASHAQLSALIVPPTGAPFITGRPPATRAIGVGRGDRRMTAPPGCPPNHSNAIRKLRNP